MACSISASGIINDTYLGNRGDTEVKYRSKSHKTMQCPSLSLSLLFFLVLVHAEDHLILFILHESREYFYLQRILTVAYLLRAL